MQRTGLSIYIIATDLQIINKISNSSSDDDFYNRTRIALIKRVETDFIYFFISVYHPNPCHLCSIFLICREVTKSNYEHVLSEAEGSVAVYLLGVT